MFKIVLDRMHLMLFNKVRAQRVDFQFITAPSSSIAIILLYEAIESHSHKTGSVDLETLV